MHLLFDSYFGEGKIPVLGEILERWRGGRWGSGRRRRKRGREADKEFSSCSPYLQLTLRKNGSIYLPFPSIYLPSSIHQYLSFPRGGWTCLAIHSAALYFNTRMEAARLQMLTLTCAQPHLHTASTPPSIWVPSLRHSEQHCLMPILVTMFSLEEALFTTSSKINLKLSH